MRVKRVRQILKSFADDTRLRIINLLDKQELSVSELCDIFRKNQPNISKHLARMRLTGIVGDRRQGLNVYYYLIRPENKTHKELLNAIITGLSDSQIFKNDLIVLKRLKKSVKINLKGGEKR